MIFEVCKGNKLAKVFCLTRVAFVCGEHSNMRDEWEITLEIPN